MNIFIPNTFCYAAIGIIKTLKRLSRYDVRIIGSGEESYGIASGSKLTDLYIQSPALSDTLSYKLFLIDTIKKENIDLIIAVLDSDLEILNSVTEHLSAKYVSPSDEIIALFRDKLKATYAIKEIGINVPTIINNLNGPIICRQKTGVGSVGVKKIDLAQITGYKKNDFFVQKLINGREFTVDVLCDKNGLPHLIIPRERLLILNGLSFKTRLVYNKELIDAIFRIAENFILPGLWNAQFIISNDDVFFLELNPRFAGSAIAGIVSSFNYLDIYIDHFVYGKEMPVFEEMQNNIVWGSIVTKYYEELVSL